MDQKEKQIREDIAEFVEQMEAITGLAESENRDMTDEEATEWDGLKKKADQEQKKLDRHLALQEQRERLNKGALTINDKGQVVKNDDIVLGANRTESLEALNEFTGQMYRALCAPRLDSATRQKNITDAVQKLAEGNHYKGFGIKNAVDAFTTLIDADGGIFLPTTISDQIMSIAMMYGVFPANSMRIPMDIRSIKKIPNYSGNLTFHAVNEGSEVASSKFVFGGLDLNPLKWMCIVPWTNELDSTAAARLVPIINGKIGEAWAGIIDDTIINGTGTSAYHSIKGFINKSDDAAVDYVVVATAAATHTGFTTIDIFDLINAQLSVAAGIRNRGIYVFHPDWDIRLRKLKDGDSRPLFLNQGDLSLVNGKWFIGGRPVFFTEKMPNTTGTSKDYGLFYVPNYLVFGDVGGFVAEQLTEATIKASDGTTAINLGAADMRALRVKGFFDVEFSALTSDSLGAFVVLETAAS